MKFVNGSETLLNMLKDHHHAMKMHIDEIAKKLEEVEGDDECYLRGQLHAWLTCKANIGIIIGVEELKKK